MSTKHVKGSKTKYQAGTIVTTETKKGKQRRAEVQADGRWKWLPSNEVKEAKTEKVKVSPTPFDNKTVGKKPRVKRVVSLEQSSKAIEKQAIALSEAKPIIQQETRKERIPKNPPPLQRQNARLKLDIPKPKENNAFSRENDLEESKPLKRSYKRRKREKDSPKKGWLSWL